MADERDIAALLVDDDGVVGVSRAMLSQIELGRSVPTINVVVEKNDEQQIDAVAYRGLKLLHVLRKIKNCITTRRPLRHLKIYGSRHRVL